LFDIAGPGSQETPEDSSTQPVQGHHPHQDRRVRPDRRKWPTPLLSRYTFVGSRRRTVRRKDDAARHIFVDRYGERLWLVLMLFLVLAVLDAILTLVLVENGLASEANPIMAFYLEHGNLTFFGVKILFTAFALLTFCVCKNRPFIKVTILVLMAAYLAVVIYQLTYLHRADLL
jgi:hypothetical protein